MRTTPGVSFDTFRFSFAFPLLYSPVEFMFIKCFHFVRDFSWYFATFKADGLYWYTPGYYSNTHFFLHLSYEELFVNVSGLYFAEVLWLPVSVCRQRTQVCFLFLTSGQHLLSHCPSGCCSVLILSITLQTCASLFFDLLLAAASFPVVFSPPLVLAPSTSYFSESFSLFLKALLLLYHLSHRPVALQRGHDGTYFHTWSSLCTWQFFL